MVVEIGFQKVLKRTREEGEPPFDRTKIENAILKAAAECGGFQRHIPSEEVFGKEFMIEYRDLSDEQISHTLTDEIILILNSKNWMPLDVEAHAEYPHQHYRPTVNTIQDTVVHTMWEKGFLDVAEAYLRFMSVKGHHRSGELNKHQMPLFGYPSRKFLGEQIKRYKDYGCDTIEGVNDVIGKAPEIIEDVVNDFDLQLERGLELFGQKADKVKVITFTGPSSSGKTTATRRFCHIVEEKYGIKKVPVSVDNYFKTVQPIDPHGDRIYELPESIDLWLLQNHFSRILKGEAVQLPKYDFKTSIRYDEGKDAGPTIQLKDNQVLVVDSHIGAFPTLHNLLSTDEQFMMYLIPFNMIKDENDQFIERSYTNMMRRWLRDKRTRGTQYDFNIPHWKYVRLGELRDIIPRMLQADIIINTGLPFEFNYMSAKFKDSDFKLPTPEHFMDKGRLYGAMRCWQAHNLLNKFKPANQKMFSETVLPSHAIFREFIGGSIYDAH